MKTLLLNLLLIASVVIPISCSIDYSLLEGRRCDNEGRCLPGYICDRRTMLCVRPETLVDIGYTDIISDESLISDRGIEDIGSDSGCTPTNNGIEICDGIDNDCDGQTDEDPICQRCTITESITEDCNEDTSCNKCFFVRGVKFICVSVNGSDFSWTSESEIECNSTMEGKIIRCENRCFLCKDGEYGEPFLLENESCDNRDNNCNGIIDEGEICQTNEICVDGQCIERPCQTNDDCPQGKVCKDKRCSTCTDITDDDLCGTGKICVNGACIEGDCHQDSDCTIGICMTNKCCPDCCREKSDCPEEKVCKSGKCSECIDIVEDWRCGLGYICEDKRCIKGECHPSIGCLGDKICVNYYCCKPGPSCCNKEEHCKANMTCTPTHTCECKSQYGDCNNNYSDGCETDLSKDINNCGICNQRCTLPNAEPECVGGTCKIKECDSGFNNCDQNDSNGCETDSRTDRLNCGGCGNICDVQNANEVCVNSGCKIGSCISPYEDCDGQYSSGCEVDTSNDVNNCGSCGIECVADNATTECKDSKCTIKSCNPGFADCNNKYEDGCETDIYNDPKNCGKCDKKCLNNEICVDGICESVGPP